MQWWQYSKKKVGWNTTIHSLHEVLGSYKKKKKAQMQRYGLFFLEQLSLRRENCFTFLLSPRQVLLFYRSPYSLHPLNVSYSITSSYPK